MEQTISKTTNTNLDDMVKRMCDVAKAGLARCYAGDVESLPHTLRTNRQNEIIPDGFNIRYAAISQIGIAHWRMAHPDDTEELPDLWPKISDNFKNMTHIGDLALSVWAGAQSHADNCERFAQALKKCWHSQSDSCNAVELGWVVQACIIAQQQAGCVNTSLQAVLDDAYGRLLMLFDPAANLFLRHHRTGLREMVSRRISCFADQVYPIIALSHYGTCFDDRRSLEVAAHAAEQICRYQGKLGQWWWHYDVSGGKVCEEYPVFSVHQDSMAPMAIRASDMASMQDHSKEIKLGLFWLFGNNELEVPLVHTGQGIIWRSIERREPDKLSRKLRSLCAVAGLSGLHRLAGRCIRGLRINRECRPYHLGWILYAWAHHNTN
jgi:hypothetical protein